MATEGEGREMSQREMAGNIKRAAFEDFQKRMDRDPLLATKAIIDPLGTLLLFGLIDSKDKDLSMEVTRGSLQDIAYLREVVTAGHGLANTTIVRSDDSQDGIAARVRWSVTTTVCVTFCIRGICVHACTTVTTYPRE